MDVGIVDIWADTNSDIIWIINLRFWWDDLLVCSVERCLECAALWVPSPKSESCGREKREGKNNYPLVLLAIWASNFLMARLSLYSAGLYHGVHAKNVMNKYVYTSIKKNKYGPGNGSWKSLLLLKKMKSGFSTLAWYLMTYCYSSTSTNAFLRLHGYVDIYVVFIYTSTHKHIYTYIHVNIYTHIHTNKCMHTHTHNICIIHICTNIQTYAKHIHKIINK